MTVDDVCILYMQHAEQYYRRQDGQPTSEIGCLRHALRPLVKLFGTIRAREVTPPN